MTWGTIRQESKDYRRRLAIHGEYIRCTRLSATVRESVCTTRYKKANRLRKRSIGNGATVHGGFTVEVDSSVRGKLKSTPGPAAESLVSCRGCPEGAARKSSGVGGSEQPPARPSCLLPTSENLQHG